MSKGLSKILEEMYRNKLCGHAPLVFLCAILFSSKQLKKDVIALGKSKGRATLCNYICKNIYAFNIQFDINFVASKVYRNALVVADSGKMIRAVQ